MSQKTVNPYTIIGTQYVAGLNAIIAALPGSPTIDDLVTAVYNYVQPIYYPVSGGATVPLQIQTEIRSIANHVINSYVNSLISKGNAMFTIGQRQIINLLIGPQVSENLPIYLSDWINDVQDNITKEQFTIQQQIPLLISTAVGESAVVYWRLQIVGSTPWSTYFILNNNDYNSIPEWVAASMDGALAGYGANMLGLVQPTINKSSTVIISALIGSLTIAAGKVIFGWIPRIQ